MAYPQPGAGGFNWTQGLQEPRQQMGQQMYGPQNFGSGYQAPMQQALGAMGGGRGAPGFAGVPQRMQQMMPRAPQTMFAPGGAEEAAYQARARAMAGQQAQRPGGGMGQSPFGQFAGQVPNVQSLFGAFIPGMNRGTAPPMPPAGVTGDPMGGLLGGMGMGEGGMNPQILQALSALFGNRMGR